MAKTRGKSRDQDVPHIVEPEAAEPNCPRCKEQEFGSQARKVGTSSGAFIYCKRCGCIVGWAANPK